MNDNKRSRPSPLACGLAAATLLLSGIAPGQAGEEFQALEMQQARALLIGKALPAVRALDAKGKPTPLLDGKAKWTIVAFLSTRCPCTARYLTRLQSVTTQFAARSVRLVGVNSNANERPDDVVIFAREQHLTFPLLKDPDGSVARALRPQATPEVFVFDAKRTLRYHGPIDDSLYGDDIKQFYLRDALDALTNHRPLARPDIKPFGCAILIPKK